MDPPSSATQELKFRSVPGARVVTRFTHIRRLLWKNWMLKKRHAVAIAGKVLLPVLFAILLTALKSSTDNVDVPAGFSKTTGKLYTMGDPNGYSARAIDIVFGYPVSQARYMASEPTMLGLLMHIGVQYSNDINSSFEVNDTDTTERANSIAYYGSVSTVATSLWLIPANC